MSEHAYAGPRMAQPRRLAHARRDLPRSPLVPLAGAGGCVAMLALIWSVAELVPAVHLKDAVTLYHFTTLSRPRLDSIGHFLLHLLEPGLFVLWGIALLAAALARERPRVAFAVLVVLALAPFTAELLKPLLAHSHDEVGNVTVNASSWPSGHSTAATSLALCAVLVAPDRLRPLLAVLGAAFVGAVSFFLLVLAWHMPSDVLGGYFVAGFWAALALAGLRASERIRPSRTI
jgi:membrane-associated phospholipid phosphatase